MDIRTYISSGIIESYLLGLVTEAEAQELEGYAAEYTEVRDAIEEQRLALEAYAMSQQVTPPGDMKVKIWERLQAANSNPLSGQSDEEASSAALNISTSKQPFISWLVAACVILLIGSVITNIVLWRQQQVANAAIAAMLHKQQQQSKELSIKNNAIVAYEQYVRLMRDPNTITVTMEAVGDHTSNTAAILWNKITKEVFLAHNNLPEAPAGKQYQLWAIVDGKPVSAGLFNAGQTALLIPMKAIEHAEMFAVTLEPQGGNVTPTLDQMYVAGKI